MSKVSFRPFQKSDRAWVMRENLRFYRSVHGFDASFGDALAAALDLLEPQRENPTCTYLIAENRTDLIGCIFLSADDDRAARMRLFYLKEEHRTKGIGALLLQHVIAQASKNGFELIRVSTFDRHPEACRLYESFGFVGVATTPSNAFGQIMHQLDFELTLSTTTPNLTK